MAMAIRIKEKQIDLTKRPLLKIYYDLIYLFQRTFQKKKLLERAAIHESGHIVFTYFYGFTVRQSTLSSTPGNASTETLYGSRKVPANIIFKHLFEAFEMLEPDGKKDIIKIAHYFLVILWAGGWAESPFQEKA